VDPLTVGLKKQEMGKPINSASVRSCRGRYTRKRKSEPGFRFYALYDKIYRDDILAYAWIHCRSNQGASTARTPPSTPGAPWLERQWIQA